MLVYQRVMIVITRKYSEDRFNFSLF
jgi:hypothetical protein